MRGARAGVELMSATAAISCGIVGALMVKSPFVIVIISVTPLHTLSGDCHALGILRNAGHTTRHRMPPLPLPATRTALAGAIDTPRTGVRRLAKRGTHG